MKNFGIRYQLNAKYQNLFKNSAKNKLADWVKLITITGSSQVLIQVVNLVTGILLIRWLPTTEYAFYTLANAMLGTMTVLADAGVSTGVMAQGSKVWKDKLKLGTVLATGWELRKRLSIISIVISVPILIFLLLRQGASWMVIIPLTSVIVVSFWVTLANSLLEVAPKLNQDIKPLQKNQITVALYRMVLTVGSVFFLPFTIVALIANILPRIYGNAKLKMISSKFTGPAQPTDPTVKAEILKVVKRIMPGSVYYCISGQLTIWLISIFGNTTAIASVGALARLSMLLSFFSTLFSTLVTPRFARLSDRKELLKKYIIIQLVMLGVCVAVTIFVILVPAPVLWLLGDKYSGLHTELTLSIMAGCLSLMSGIYFGLTSSKGWPTHPALIICGNILVVIAGVMLFDISSLKGVLSFNVFVNAFPVLMHTGYFFYKISDKRYA